MTREEIKQKLNELLGLATPENQARASEILTGLSDEIESVLTTSETNATKIQELTANNETLRAVNAKLFLKVGETEKTPPAPDAGEPKPVEGDNDVTFDNLFNDKGELI